MKSGQWWKMVEYKAKVKIYSVTRLQKVLCMYIAKVYTVCIVIVYIVILYVVIVYIVAVYIYM